MSTDRLRGGLLAVLFAAGLAGCGATEEHGHAHDDGEDAHAHDESGDHGGGDAWVFTDVSETAELFVEFPPLVAGQASTFAAHVTRLSDHAPLTRGTVDVVLDRNGREVARFRVREPARAGLFTPAVTPRDPGEHRVTVEVSDGAWGSRHVLGTFDVAATPADARVDQTPVEGEIGYLKEQQWTAPFATATVAERPLRASVPGHGEVLAPGDAGALVRAPAEGWIAAGPVALAGTTVEAGDELATLVPRLGADGDLGALRVALERARSAERLARRELERVDGLVAQGALPERRRAEAREALDVAAAELAAARARLEQRGSGASEAGLVLRAPVAGEIVEAWPRPGAHVAEGDLLYRIAAPGRRWLEVRVPERYATGLVGASGAWTEVDGAGPVVLDADRGARVVQVGSAIDPVSRTAAVTIEYPTAVLGAPIGARLSAHVYRLAPAPRLAVPRSAVIDDGGRAVVYVQTGGETFARRPVELGIVDGDLVEVRTGVAPGERVVSEGAYLVRLAASGGDEIGHGHAH
jgi:RND family efflux transporter MFP subunit